METNFEITKNGKTIKVEECGIDTWSVWACANHLKPEGIKITLNGHSYVLGYNNNEVLFGSPLAIHLYKSALKIYQSQK